MEGFLAAREGNRTSALEVFAGVTLAKASHMAKAFTPCHFAPLSDKRGVSYQVEGTGIEKY